MSTMTKAKIIGQVKPKEPNETEITRAIRAVLKAHGVFHWKNWGGPMGEKGVPDILGVYHGRMLAIEVKTRIGTVKEHQQKFIDRINREGGLAFVARSVQDVVEALGLSDRILFASTKRSHHLG